MTPASSLHAEFDAIQRSGARLHHALLLVAGGALVFTCINVTLFATAERVPWQIAWLLDPLASIAFVSVLLAEGHLSRHGRQVTGWPVLLKWVAGLLTWAMNIWASAFALDAAGLLLHSVAPALVLLLAEAAPRLRLQFAGVAGELATQLARIEAAELARIERERQARETATELARQTITPAAAPAAPPAPRQRKNQPARQAPDLAVLVARARQLLAQNPGMGRPALAKELGTTQHRARQALDVIAQEQPPRLAVAK
jgi:hypothetical protein